tara:strand:- start:1783 stop:2613 length:831 start_codon:yes stop_codon:yes gene_type:complete
MSRITFTVGHDAEVFVYNENDEATPGIGIIDGSKRNPRSVPGGALQEDNVMAELNINPAKTSDEFVTNTLSVMDELNGLLSPHNLKFKVKAFQTFEPEFLKSKQAREFGCEPDSNIYTLSENKIDVSNLVSKHARTAGGHIHLGLSDANFHPSARMSLVKACDVFIGLPLATVDDTMRKRFYGRAGSYRHKEYGIEYRTPSNIWLNSSDTMEWMFKQCSYVCNNVIRRLGIDDIPEAESIINDIGEDFLQDIINQGFVDDAYDICERFQIQLPQGL